MRAPGTQPTMDSMGQTDRIGGLYWKEGGGGCQQTEPLKKSYFKPEFEKVQNHNITILVFLHA